MRNTTEYYQQAVAEMDAEDSAARARGEAHGNYGEEYRASVEDVINLLSIVGHFLPELEALRLEVRAAETMRNAQCDPRTPHQGPDYIENLCDDYDDIRRANRAAGFPRPEGETPAPSGEEGKPQ